MSRPTAQKLATRLHDCGSDRLAYITGGSDTAHRYKADADIPLEMLSPLAQVRAKFHKARLLGLAESIARSGLRHRISVHAMTRDDAERYIALLGVIWGAEHTLDEIPTIVREGETYFLVFISGERRFRAITWLTRNVCSECEERGITEPCFPHHFPSGTIPVQLTFGSTALEAYDCQVEENCHEKPDSHEDAMSFRAGFELRKIRNSRLTVAAYARSVGRDAQTVRRALAYTELPSYIQEAVAEGNLAYSKALVLQRFHAERNDDGILEQWVTFAIERRSLSTNTLRRVLADDLADFKSGQMSFFGESDRQVMAKQARKRALDGQMRKDLTRITEFLIHVMRSRKRGDIGKDDSPFSSLAVARAVLEMWELLTMVTPELLNDLPRRDQQRIEEIRTDIDPMMAEVAEIVKQSASAK